MIRVAFSAALLSAALLAATLVAAPLPLRAQPSDGVELLFGRTNIGAVTGHGGLTAGISRDGDLTVLVWPNPSYCDQLGYITSNGEDARERPRFGAEEGAGVFFGLRVERADGSREVHWLRDFETHQSYGSEDGPNVVTSHRSDALGLRVTVTDAISPDADLLVREVRVERDAASPVTAAWLISYSNLSPTPPGARIPELPLVDWAFDGRNDFAAIWDRSASAVIHFHPGDQRAYTGLGSLIAAPRADWGVIGEALAAGTPDEAELATLAAGLDGSYSAGAYLAVTTSPPPDQHQVGYDATAFCDTVDEIVDNLRALTERYPEAELPLDPAVAEELRCDRTLPSIPEQEGWTHVAEDAFADAADGELSGSGLAAGEVSSALRTPLSFDAAGVADAALLIGAGSDAAAARAVLAAAPPAREVIADARSTVEGWLSGLRLPTSTSSEVLAVARRSLINLRVGTDAETGAIVASIARQAPYGLDWPRDGMFFNVALDISGQSALVTRRTRLYAQWQRKTDVTPTLVDIRPPTRPDGTPLGGWPAGGWEMNYYSDGRVGGLWRFEIDNTAFALWTLVAHAGWVESDPEGYLRERWDAIQLGADHLAGWRDRENGLQWPAQEDDNAAYTQTLHGAVTVFGALDISSRAARMLGEDAAARRWEARAGELREAILRLLYDQDAERFVSRAASRVNPGSGPTGPTAWLVWPMRLLPWEDPRIGRQIAADLEIVTPVIELADGVEGGAYVMKTTVSAALVVGEDPILGPRVHGMLEAIAAQATPGTHHFGEVMVVQEGPGGRHADQRVSNPHLWEGTLFYLTAMALESPEELLRYDRVLPASRVPEPRLDEQGGCCSVTAGAGSGSRRAALTLALLGLAVLARRRRSRTTPGG